MMYPILGITWDVNVFSPDDYINKHGTDSRGITVTDKFIMDFREDELNIELVVHELVHAYLDSQVNFFSIEEDKQEENVAEFFEKFGSRIIHDSRIIYDQLTKEKI